MSSSAASSPNYTPCPPPPSRSGSTAEELYDLTMSCITEYHATSADTADTADTADFDEKVLESDVFKWHELTTFASSDPTPVANSDSDCTDCTDSNGSNCSDDYSDMPPLIGSESDESNTEDHEEDIEQGQEQEIPTPAPREIPPLITFLGLMLFLLHLFYYVELLQEREERAKNPCFRMNF